MLRKCDTDVGLYFFFNFFYIDCWILRQVATLEKRLFNIEPISAETVTNSSFTLSLSLGLTRQDELLC